MLLVCSSDTQVNLPSGVTALPDGRLVFAEANNNSIRVVSKNCHIRTLVGFVGVGHVDGKVNEASVSKPLGLCTMRDGAAFA